MRDYIRESVHLGFAALVCVTGILLSFGVPLFYSCAMLVCVAATYIMWVRGKTPVVIKADPELAKDIAAAIKAAQEAAAAAKTATTDMGQKLVDLTQGVNSCLQKYELQRKLIFEEHGLNEAEDFGNKPLGMSVQSQHETQGQRQGGGGKFRGKGRKGQHQGSGK
jgi:hypothetical protein